VLTGTLSSMSREKAKEIILTNGGIILTTVNKNTRYVVAEKIRDPNIQRLKNLELRYYRKLNFLKW